MSSEDLKTAGRPRSASAQAAILKAAFGLLVESGYDAMSIEAVADRAGVGKATIYRRWATRQDLAVDAFFNATKSDLAFPDTGSAGEDFRLQIRQLVQLLRGPLGRAMPAMLAAARTDDALRQALFTRWIEPRQRWGMARITRAIADGECVPRIDPKIALDLLYGPVYSRLLFGMGLPDDTDVAKMFSMVSPAVFVPRTGTAQKQRTSGKSKRTYP